MKTLSRNSKEFYIEENSIKEINCLVKELTGQDISSSQIHRNIKTIIIETRLHFNDIHTSSNGMKMLKNIKYTTSNNKINFIIERDNHYPFIIDFIFYLVIAVIFYLSKDITPVIILNYLL